MKRVVDGKLAWLPSSSWHHPFPNSISVPLRKKIQNYTTVDSRGIMTSSDYSSKIISHPCKIWEGCLSICPINGCPPFYTANKETELEILKVSVLNHRTSVAASIALLAYGDYVKPIIGEWPGNNWVAVAWLLPCLQKSRRTQTKRNGNY